MGKDTKNKPKGWLKGVLTNHNDSISEYKLNDEHDLKISHEQTMGIQDQGNMDSLSESSKSILPFSKDNKDKVTLDIVSAVENLLNDRQLIILENKGFEEQLHNANETISRLKYELTKNEQIIHEKDKEVRNLEGKLTTKQMNYDQLLEDYKDYQKTSTNGFENLKYQLEKESNKYNRLDDEYTNYKYQNLLKVKDLEERIRDLEVENENNCKKYQKIFEEKTKLLQTINEFTERMSFSFSPSENTKISDNPPSPE